MTNGAKKDFEIPGRISLVNGKNSMPLLVMGNRDGASASIYLHGAHIVSWKTPETGEHFFISAKSGFEDGTPIRGGIPLIFPQFSGDGPLPKHGVARTREWSLVETEAPGENETQCTLELKDTEETRAVWNNSFVLRLKVRLTESLDVSMDVLNSGDTAFEFSLAFHTYFNVVDIADTEVLGLKGCRFVDALESGKISEETRDRIRFDRETDRVYLEAPSRVMLRGTGSNIDIESNNMPDVCVWNPWVEKSAAMEDFGDEEYRRMVCVETGRIKTRMRLEPGVSWTGQTVFHQAE